jgi:outer membrane receptor for ferrienterochelin and colicins
VDVSLIRPKKSWRSGGRLLAVVGSAVVLVGGTTRVQAGGDIEEVDLAALLSTPEEVWTATKTEQKNTEAPAIITTVTREQIGVWGYRSISEVLSHLLGFYVVDDHTSPNLAVRGISGGLYADSSIVKVLIDGHSVAFHSTGGNWLGPELIPLSAVERIEVVRGPASALFGADAFLGVINIKTRSGKSLSGATAWLTGGRAGTKLATDLDVSAGFEKDDLDMVVAVRRNSQDLSGLTLPDSSPAPSVPDSGEEGSRTAQGLDQASTSALARLTYRPRTGTEVGVFGYFSSMKRGEEFGSLFQLVNNRVALSQMRAGLFLEQSLTPSLRLSFKGTVFRGGPGDSNRLEVGSEYYYVRRQFGFRGGDLDGQVEWTPGWGEAGSVRLVAGASAFLDDEQLPSRVGISKQATDDQRQLKPGDVIQEISIYQGRKSFLNTGSYLQGMWKALDHWLSLTGGLRYDRHNVYGGQLSERIGLVSNPLSNLHAKLLYGSAFKAPSPLLLHAIPSAIGDVVGNPQLKPQFVRTAEFQLAWEPTDYLSLTGNGVYNVLSDKTEFVQQGINKVARNVARAATLSWELMAEFKYQSVVKAHLSYEAQRTIRRTGQDGYSAEVVGSAGGIYPTMMFHGGLAAQPTGLPLRGTIQASFIGERRPSDTNILLNGGAYIMPSYLLLEAGLATTRFDLFGLERHEISFHVTGKNLLGAKGPAPGFSGVDYPLAPRTFLLQVNLAL